MTTYLILYALIGLMGYVSYRAQHRFSNLKSTLGWLSFFFVFVVLALRHQSMGIDLGYYSVHKTGYLDSFDVLSNWTWGQILTTKKYLNYEYGYILFNKLVGSIWHNRQFFLAVCAMISIYPIAKATLEKSTSPITSIIIYLSLPTFEILFSGLRQGVALGICFWSIRYIHQRKPFHFLLTVLSACFFHDSSLVFLLAYPIYHIKPNITFRLLSILVIPVFFLFRYEFFNILRLILSQDIELDNNGAINLLILFTGIYAICSLFTKEDDVENNGYLNLFYVGCIVQVFANLNSIALRVGYYYISCAMLLIPNIVTKMEPRLRVIAKLAVVLFFVVFGLSRLYNSTWTMAYPYFWFWQVR